MGNRILITIICFALALGLGFGLVWPKYQDYRGLKLEVEKKETELSYHQQYFKELKEIDSKLKEYQASLSKIERAFPDYFSIPAFFANSERISSQSGMILNQISGGSVQEKNGLKERHFNLSLSGDLANFESFLSTLEKTIPLIEVENFSFSSSEGEGGGETVDFSLGIKTYSY
jgi:Tfp pilus assembly protein PilO